jgi:hypothetical protein
MVRWKLLMRRVTMKGKGGRWESALDKEEEDEFRNLLQDLNNLREIRFPRCVQPLEGQFRRPLLLVFGDGSREACCTLVYLRWEREDSTACCRLVTGKIQVAGDPGEDNHPKYGASGGSQLSKVGQEDKGDIEDTTSGDWFFTDTSAVLGMLRTESGRFNEFVGARVSEVKVNSDVEGEWRWLEGNCNPADLGTSSNATPQDMAPGSEYQVGKPWMAEPEGTWPCKKSFSPAPEEEFRKDMLEGACNVVKELRPSQGEEEDFPVAEKGGLEHLVRVYGSVMAVVYKWRKKKGAVGPVIINPNGKGSRKIGYPSLECRRSAE